MSGDPFDFDAFYATTTDVEPIPITAFGETFTVPAEQPAVFALLVARVAMLKAEGRESDPSLDRLSHDAYSAVVGEARFERWIVEGRSWAAIGAFMGEVHRLWRERLERLGEAVAPVPGASPPAES